MNPERLLQCFLQLVQIDSPSFHEAKVAAWCQKELEACGCRVRIDDSSAQTGSDTGNLIAYMPARGRSGRLYFSAHMDTVSPGEGIRPQITDGVIRSAGDTVLGGDDKSGVAAIIEMVRTFDQTDLPHPELVILLSVAEECGLLGAAAIDGSDFAGEPCLVLDAEGPPGVVIIGAPYHHEFTARFIGRASHAGVKPEDGLSAIVLAARAISGMHLGRLDDMTTANIGTIQGGRANNVVADTCIVTGEFRSLKAKRLNEVQVQLAAAIQDAVATGGGDVEVDWTQAYPGFKVEASDPLVQLVLNEAQKLGLRAEARCTGGGSDANVLADKGLRPLVLGCGMTAVHSLKESLVVEDLENTARLAIACAVAYGDDI
ncbi:MAG: M20/M25/M40 family metallo-hydrolase [Actinomycetia bacterium]|nr:M20/M25/M40 family metallo-hydrolase [Actinomycetes bacterium]